MEALHIVKTEEGRRILRASGQYLRLARHNSGGNKDVYVHLVAETPGEKASIVPHKAASSQSFDVTTASPPPAMEFMDGDAFLYANGNHVCFCSTGMKIAAVRVYFTEVFRLAKLRNGADSFDLLNAANANAIDLIHKIGVKEVQFRGALYSASAEYSKRKNQAIGSLGAAGRHLKAVFGREHDVAQDGLQIGLTLKVDGRSKNLTLGRKRINEIAAEIVQDHTADDEYTIILQDDKKIKPDAMYVSGSKTIEAIGKSVSRDHAWEALAEYFTVLKKDGVLAK